MIVSGWGSYPMADVLSSQPKSHLDVLRLMDENNKTGIASIARGLGRSYGDSSLAENVMSLRQLDNFIRFDAVSGLLCCQAGVSLAEILELIMPKGWFLPVVPGTKHITIGGAIASDVHGKNHHNEGGFCDHVESLVIATIEQGLVECSPTKNSALFHATCGGMGLIGVILEVTVQLKPIKSALIDQVLIKAANLESIFQLFEAHNSAHYSVAWIDCLAKGAKLGRSILMLGEHASTGELSLPKKRQFSVPAFAPGCLLTPFTIKAFNQIYFHRHQKQETKQLVDYDSYFFPLDGLKHWPRLYGKSGFCQYQFVLPKENAFSGIKQVIEKVSGLGAGSFLAVLKKLGHKNKNLLSFPMEGYTLALDFKVNKTTLSLLDELDQIVLAYNGRIYLTKDARMSYEVFRRSYRNIDEFEAVRKQYGACAVFNSLQSKRLKIR